MIYLQLFLTFLEVGAVSFGGGYGMISLIREKCLSHGWLTDNQLMNFIAVSESTPGPIAVNMATFVGSSQGGILGALCATLGVVLPSFIIILLVAAVITKLLRYAGVKSVINGIKPVIVGLILATAVTMFLNVVFALSNVQSASETFSFDWRALIIFSVIAIVALIWKFWKKKSISPIILIVVSAGLGMLCYGV